MTETETQINVDLAEAVRVLETTGRSISIDLGTHQYCAIDSNCPKAVELRRMMGEMGVTVDEVVARSVILTPPEPNLAAIEQINGVLGQLNVYLGESREPISIDYTEYVSDNIRAAIQERLHNVQYVSNRLNAYARDLTATNLHRLRDMGRTRMLEQLKFSTTDLLKYRAMTSTDADGRNYLIFLPIRYAPRLVYSNGISYDIVDADKEAIKRKGIYTQYTINPNRRSFVVNPLNVRLVSNEFATFEHYHGGGGRDCWGGVQLESSWDGTLPSLYRYHHRLEGALVTINMNSLLQRNPLDMPPAQALYDRARAASEGQQTDTPIITPLDEDDIDDWWDGDGDVTGDGEPAATWGEGE